MTYRVGQGFDIHAFQPGKTLRIGGVTLPSDFGLRGHSDGDVLLHALCDALLGAAGLGDIGEHFPDTDPNWRDADSQVFIREVMALLARQQWCVANVDATILTEKPRITPFKPAIKTNIATLLQIDAKLINIKAKTLEQLGALGRAEGMAAMVTVGLRAKLD